MFSQACVTSTFGGGGEDVRSQHLLPWMSGQNVSPPSGCQVRMSLPPSGCQVRMPPPRMSGQNVSPLWMSGQHVPPPPDVRSECLPPPRGCQVNMSPPLWMCQVNMSPPWMSGQHVSPPRHYAQAGGTHPTGMHSCYELFIVTTVGTVVR